MARSLDEIFTDLAAPFERGTAQLEEWCRTYPDPALPSALDPRGREKLRALVERYSVSALSRSRLKPNKDTPKKDSFYKNGKPVGICAGKKITGLGQITTTMRKRGYKFGFSES